MLYKRALKTAKYFGVLPYNRNSESQELEYLKICIRFANYITQYLLYLMYNGFVMYRYIHVSFDEMASITSKASLRYVAFAYMVPSMVHCVVFSNHENLHNFMNRLLFYVREDFQSKFLNADDEHTIKLTFNGWPIINTGLPDDGRKLRNIGAFIRIIVPYTSVAVVCLNMATLFRRPESPHLLTSLIPDVENRPGWELIPFALIQGYLWCNQWTSILFIDTLVFTHISATLNALNRTRLVLKKMHVFEL